MTTFVDFHEIFSSYIDNEDINLHHFQDIQNLILKVIGLQNLLKETGFVGRIEYFSDITPNVEMHSYESFGFLN